MRDDGKKTCHSLEEIRQSIEQEDRASIARAKLGILVRSGMLALMVGYMAWLSGTVDRLSAVELTRFAAAHLESKLPEFRAELRDYAIDQAPEITDRAQELLLAMPARLRADSFSDCRSVRTWWRDRSKAGASTRVQSLRGRSRRTVAADN